MTKSMTAMEQEILKSAVKAEIDFITYVDVRSGGYKTIITDEQTHVIPPVQGNYTAVNDETIPVYVHPEDREYCAAQFALSNIIKTLAVQELMVIPYRLLCGTEYRRKEMNIYYYGADRNTIIMVRRDVTESYRVEQKQKEQLYQAFLDTQRANAEKREFLERMSHEVRTPMNSIIGLTYLTREQTDNKKQVIENLKNINLSAHFLLSFVEDILNLSQIESGSVALMPVDTDFEIFLEKIRKAVAGLAEKKSISFAVEKRDVLNRNYRIDAGQLEKALMNILSNAVKYTKPGGRVDFIVEKIAECDTETTVRFKIRDTGIGMDEAFLPIAFEPFAQENNRGTTLDGGTGLGLSIAKNIIGIMNGEIDVYSEKGKGTTFVVTVPLEKAPVDESGSSKKNGEESLDYDFTGRRVLLVEDNAINIEITKNILTHKHFEVEAAEDGEQGVMCFLTHGTGYYDAILMDIRMPVMDGLEATRRIREAGHADSKKIPIIAMTANAFEEDVRKSLEAGMDAHLSKPVEIRQMYQVLDEMINR